MAPEELVSALLLKDGEKGQRLLQAQFATLDTSSIALLVDLIKREADRQWNKDAQISLRLGSYLLAIGKMTSNTSYHALGLMTQGDALRRLDRDEEALPFFDAAGEEFLQAGDEVGWARTRIGRVSSCLQLNRTDEALQDTTAAREVFMRYGKLLRAGQIDVNAAIINYELGQYDQALRLFDRALETYSLQGEGVDLNVARARGNKAITLAAQGRFHEAVALHEQARTTFASYSGQEVAVAREELNIAKIYASQAHYSQALHLFNRSRATFQEHQLDIQAAEVAQHICLCLVRLNRAREAYELANETVIFFRTLRRHHHNIAYSLMYQAEAAMIEGNVQEADTLLREASHLLEEGGYHSLAAIVRLQQAELSFANGFLEESQREAEYVADAFAAQEALPQLARTALLQARIALAMGDLPAAEHLCNQSLDIAQGQGLLDLKYRCDYLLGQIAERRFDLNTATRYYDRAIQSIDEVQSRLVLDSRTSFLEDKGNIYQRAIVLALKRGNKEQALVYVEKAKSRVLGDYLRNNIDIRLRAGDTAGEAILEDLTKLREEQAWYSSIVYAAENEANLSESMIIHVRTQGAGQARQEMQQRERRIEQLLEQMHLRLAGDLVARQNPHWADDIVTSLCPKLGRKTLMLEYYFTEEDLYIFQLTHEGVNVRLIQGVVPKLKQLLSFWRVNIALTSEAAGTPEQKQTIAGLEKNSLGLLQRLYNILLRPVADALSTCDQVIIVPYGMLHYLPFHALFDGKQFVIERMDLSYLPAAALFDICQQRGKHIMTQRTYLSNSLVMGLSDGGRLPYAVQEAKAVAKQLGTSCVLDQDATASLLWEASASSLIIHIAAHGLFRLDAPNFSYIKLADRQLSAIEVFNLDLSSCSLVTLSACETGRGAIGGVDEVIGLGRGLLYAGAASLLPTLWKVDDASSAELMEMFYQSLLADLSKTTALAGAQRAFLARVRASKQPYRAHPYFWAAFHLIGDSGLL